MKGSPPNTGATSQMPVVSRNSCWRLRPLREAGAQAMAVSPPVPLVTTIEIRKACQLLSE